MPGEPADTVLFVSLPAGVGGSVRSLGTVLAHVGLRRAVAVPADTSAARFIVDRGLADELVDLQPRSGTRVVGAAKDAARLSRRIIGQRRRLVAVHANGLSELHVVAPSVWITGRPVVCWFHEQDVTPAGAMLARRWTAHLRQLTWAVVSEVSGDLLVSSGVPWDRLTIVPNPIDPVDVVASRHQEPRQAAVVGYVGTPARYKGFHLLPDIVARLGETPTRFAVFAGPESMEPEVWPRLRALPTVEIKGKMADVRQAYGSVDIILCPSLSESFGRVAVEAMANGLPVVASDVPALRRLVGDDEAGLLFPPGDVAAAAAAIARLADDAALRARLGAAGRRRSEEFLPARTVGLLRDLYLGSTSEGR
jgi:phosphatidyl-myo-inositol alpha-mannosyltransferase